MTTSPGGGSHPQRSRVSAPLPPGALFVAPMYEDVLHDMTDSASDFLRVVWPELSQVIGGGTLLPMETMTDSVIAREFDILAGIDAWQIHSTHGIRGLATRVQWIDTTRYRPYNSFSVRYARDSDTRTEYAKQTASLGRPGWVSPGLTVQAFVAKPVGHGDLLSCAAVKTERLFGLLSTLEASGFTDRDAPGGIERYGLRRTSNASFVWVSWKFIPPDAIRIIDHTSARHHIVGGM